MEDDGSTKDDVRLPENDLGKGIRDQFNKGDSIMVSILTAMGEEAAVGTKAST